MSSGGRVVLVAGRSESTPIVYNALRQTVGVDRVILEGSVGAVQFLGRRAKKLGVRKVAGQLLFKLMVDKPLRKASRRRIAEVKRQFDLRDNAIPESAIVHVTSINTDEAIEQLQRAAPAVVVVNGTRIIARRVLESVRVPFINMHAGITPLYRGVHGGYWALAKGDRAHCGVTVHLVDPGIDTGEVIAQELIQPTAVDNFVTYPVLQLGAGLPHLVRAVQAVLEGSLRPQPAPQGESRLWSHPTLTEYVWARLQNGTR